MLLGKALLLLVVAATAMVVAGASAKGGAKPVNVIVVVPSQYVSNVTPAQAVAAAQTFLGQPSDAPCSGSTSCSIEGWFRSQIGQVFNYTVTVDTVSETIQQLAGGTPDACGSYGISSQTAIFGALANEYGYHQNGNRTVLIVLGAGGSAEHLFSLHPGGGYQSQAWGLVGDWGVEEQNGVPVSCIPSWDYPNRGFSHEFAGAMGMFFYPGNPQDQDDPVFVGDTLTSAEIANVLKNSGSWLHS